MWDSTPSCVELTGGSPHSPVVVPVDVAETATAKTAVPQCGPASLERSFDRTLANGSSACWANWSCPNSKSTILCPGGGMEKGRARASPAGD